jgi:rhamnosyltransferase
MLVKIILLVKNGERFLAESLAAIFAQRVDFAFQVLAIDSGSQDRSKEILGRFPVLLHEIAPAEFNHGVTRNLGAQLAGPDTDFLVYLTQDATPANEDWLAHLIAPFLSDASVAGAFSRHLPRPDSSPALVRQLTTVWQTGGDRRLVKSMPAERARYEDDKLFYTYFSDTSSALRRSVWEQIPFRALDFAEDADWADRALQAGYTVVFEPASAVVHSHDYSIKEQFRQNVDHVAGMEQLFAEHVLRSWRSWWRLFAGIPSQVWRDWQFTWSAPWFAKQNTLRKFAWTVHSPAWHVASALGTWVGLHLRLFPRPVRRLLSRQDGLKQR